MYSKSLQNPKLAHLHFRSVIDWGCQKNLYPYEIFHISPENYFLGSIFWPLFPYKICERCLKSFSITNHDFIIFRSQIQIWGKFKINNDFGIWRQFAKYWYKSHKILNQSWFGYQLTFLTLIPCCSLDCLVSGMGSSKSIWLLRNDDLKLTSISSD